MKSQPKHIFRNNGILIGVGLAVLFGSIFYAGFTSTTDSGPDDIANSQLADTLPDNSEMFLSKNLYSGPFAILEETYGVDDTIFHW